jgi:hypothetical protein
MPRRPWMMLGASFAIGISLSLWANRAEAVGGFVDSWLAADQEPRSPDERQQPGEGVLHFEVEPDEVEIYLDDQYLGRAHELRGRPVKGILAGNRLFELRWGADRTFLQVVVPVNGTKTIRLNLAPPRPGSSRAHPIHPARISMASASSGTRVILDSLPQTPFPHPSYLNRSFSGGRSSIEVRPSPFSYW